MSEVGGGGAEDIPALAAIVDAKGPGTTSAPGSASIATPPKSPPSVWPRAWRKIRRGGEGVTWHGLLYSSRTPKKNHHRVVAIGHHRNRKPTACQIMQKWWSPTATQQESDMILPPPPATVPSLCSGVVAVSLPSLPSPPHCPQHAGDAVGRPRELHAGRHGTRSTPKQNTRWK